MADLTVTWTKPSRHKAEAETFNEACAVAVTQSAKEDVPTTFTFAGYVYIVNAAKYDEDPR